jgi:metallo-beta-lactamase class B
MRILIVLLLISLKTIGIGQTRMDTIRVSKDIFLIKLSDHAFMHVSYSDFPGLGRIPCNGLIFIVNHHAFLFDTPVTDSQTGELVSWLKDSMKTRVRGFIPNHWHKDCMGGLGFIKKQGIATYANQRTIDIAKSRGLPVPDHGFEDSLRLELNGKNIECYYFGPAHSLDNIVVWIPSEKILFAGCMVKSLDSKNLGNTADGDLKSYPATIEKLKRKFLSAKIVIPGHGSPGGIELIEHTKDICQGN